jgi:hypothetical protein
MAGPAQHRDEKKKRTDPCDRPHMGEKDHITEEQVRHIRNQQPASAHLLRKYEYRYQQHRQHKSEEQEYERRTGRSLKRREDARDHWQCLSSGIVGLWHESTTYQRQLPGVRNSEA